MKERKKSIGEQIYPRLGRRIPQEFSRITGGEPWSSGVAFGSLELTWGREGEKRTKGCGGLLLYLGVRPIGYIRSGVRYI
jgi:hypothetical protein